MLIEILGVLFSLCYLYLEIRQDRNMWIVGFISSAFYIYIFFHAKFYADMGLNVYYVIASVYGWILWSRKRVTSDEKRATSYELQVTSYKLRVTNKDKKNIHHSTLNSQLSTFNFQLIFKLSITTALLFALLTFILWHYTDSPVPVGDALTTSLSIVATWMLAHKIIEQWWIWVFVNTISMGLYLWRGLYPTAFLFLCYAVASVIGYYRWKKSV